MVISPIIFMDKASNDNLMVEVSVKPNSPKFKVENKGKIIVYCKSKPEDNKANIEIKKELEKLFKTEVKIIKGLKSKRKTILIRGISICQFNGMIE